MTDKKVLRTISVSAFAVLSLFLLLQGEHSGRIAAMVALALTGLCVHFFIKKRSILSIYKKQILLLMTVISIFSLVLLYVTGLAFGFVRSAYARPNFFWTRALPAGIIIVLSEYIRSVLRAQNDRWADVFGYLLCVIAEVLALGNITQLTTSNQFMDFVGIVLFPAIVSNILYHYLSKRYGMLPNLVYRLLLSLYVYIIPFQSAMPEAILAFIKIIVPLIAYAFIDALYEKKIRYALKKKTKFGAIITVLFAIVMACVIMLISNQFRFGALVIATPSMTGELNVGDVAIFEQPADPAVQEGQVIVFVKDNTVVVHRVVNIQTINGRTRYYTKGDANEDLDSGFLYQSNITGCVRYKIPFVGYPTLWFRSLFAK